MEKWDIGQVMWIYWAQSVVIGCFNWKRILDLRQFSTEGFRINNRAVRPTRATQRQTAWFFLVHYGFFHVIYAFFLSRENRTLSGMPVFYVAACILIFLVNHGFSYWHNRQRDLSRTPNIGTIMFFPYARIVPMHLTIIFGSHFSKYSTGILALFLGLKTLADLIMHMVEHADARRQQATSSE